VACFLGQNNIAEPRFTFFKGQQSANGRLVFRRLYVGTDRRFGQNVSFILDVNEDFARPSVGALYLQPITNADAIYREWLDFGEYRGDLYGFTKEKLGEPMELLEARYD